MQAVSLPRKRFNTWLADNEVEKWLIIMLKMKCHAAISQRTVNVTKRCLKLRIRCSWDSGRNHTIVMKTLQRLIVYETETMHGKWCVVWLRHSANERVYSNYSDWDVLWHVLWLRWYMTHSVIENSVWHIVWLGWRMTHRATDMVYGI